MRRRRLRLDPGRELQEVREWMDDVLGSVEGGDEGNAVTLDVVDRDGEIVVTADLPGVEKEDIDVRCGDGRLSISGERETEVEEEDEGFVRRERSWGSYRREISIPDSVDCDEVSGTYRNGVLEVTLPKSEERETKEVEIE